MKDDPTSLDRLHDIVVPPEVSWWPPAPGWYVVAAILLLAVIYVLLHVWKQWQSNAYRRAALRELETANTIAAISEILRRTALAIAPRTMIATQSGAAWPQWLSSRTTIPMSDHVRKLLTLGPYQPTVNQSDITELKTYSERWISHHTADSKTSEIFTTEARRTQG